MFSEEKARKIAEDYLKTSNPTNWNGIGCRPKNFSPLIKTYDIDSINGNELDISFEFFKKEEDDPFSGWTHYCELRDIKSGDVVIPLHGYGIDSVQNLVDTIMDICSDEN